MAYNLGDLGRSPIILGIWGAKAYTFRLLRKFFERFGENNAIFLGSKGAQIPRGPQ